MKLNTFDRLRLYRMLQKYRTLYLVESPGCRNALVAVLKPVQGTRFILRAK